MAFFWPFFFKQKSSKDDDDDNNNNDAPGFFRFPKIASPPALLSIVFPPRWFRQSGWYKIFMKCHGEVWCLAIIHSFIHLFIYFFGALFFFKSINRMKQNEASHKWQPVIAQIILHRDASLLVVSLVVRYGTHCACLWARSLGYVPFV